MDPFEPINIGNLEIKNRFALAPMISNLAEPDGFTNEIHSAYLEERAKGGYGLIITEYSYIDSPLSKGSRNELSFVSFDQAPRLKRLTERIHSHNSKIFAQLVHAGGKALTEGNQKAFAPSEIPYMGKIPRELTVDEIEDIKLSFLKAAGIAETANFDGVELHGAHAYLLQEFISPSLNMRKDRYGNDFNGRIRLPQEIIDLIRKETGLRVGIRLSLYEDEPDGYDSDYGLKVAESLKNIDYVHFSSGRMIPPGSTASFYSPKGHIGLRLPRKPKVTTILVGSIMDLETVERALEKSDMVSMGRGALADPYFPLKLKSGIMPRPCIRCNQACRDLSYGQVRCTVNPITGNEIHYRHGKITGNVSIGGAGVSGMEAALYLAKEGMKVTIYEKSGKIGGELNTIARNNNWPEIKVLLKFYEEEIKRLGITVRYGEHRERDQVDIYLVGNNKYPEIPLENEIFVDSNLYRHLDQELNLSGERKVYLTERSIHSMDRHRQMEYRKQAEEAGITFVKDPDVRFKEHFIVRNQYDIYAASLKGINEAKDFLSRKVEKINSSFHP